MSKFNSVATYPTVENHEGSTSYLNTPEFELLRLVSNSLLEDKFYESAKEQMARIKSLVDNCSRDYVLKLASYSRNFLHLRSAPIYLLVLASLKRENSTNNTRLYVPKIIQRADELSEVVSAYISIAGNKNKMPNALSRGIADAFSKFSEYDFAKYSASRSKVKLRDVLCITHPKPSNDTRSGLYKRILEGKLETPKTWETFISANGSTKENWESISSNMGFMALLRNLRNFERFNATKAIDLAVEKLSDPQSVLHSKQFPFRFLSAFNEVTTPKVKEGLRKALEISVQNIPTVIGSSAILVDVSGSMNWATAKNSSMKYSDIATLMGAMAGKICENSIVMPFASESAIADLSAMDTVLTNQNKIRAINGLGGGTNGWHAIDRLIKDKTVVDRILVFTDGQMTGSNFLSSYDKYKREVNPKVKMFIFDLAGYRMSITPDYRKDIYTFSGWSDKMLRLVSIIERGSKEIDFINERF